MSDLTDAALRWLDLHNARTITHPGGTLRDHLSRVAARLHDWGGPKAVELAALTHAAYGTAGFNDHMITTDHRPELQSVIGTDAEHLVYLYGACDRRTSYSQFPASIPFTLIDRFTGETMKLTAAETRAFVAITFANEIDVMQHNDALAIEHGQTLFDLGIRSAHWLPDEARTDLNLLLPNSQ